MVVTSSVECKKVVIDIFGEIEFLMEYQNISLYAHFALFKKKIPSPFIFQNIKQKVFKNDTYDPIGLIFDKCVNARRSQVPLVTLLD